MNNVTLNHPVKIITYREERFETRTVDCGNLYFLTVAKEDFADALNEGMFNIDYTAFELADQIDYFCTEEEFLLPDQELSQLIWG